MDNATEVTVRLRRLESEIKRWLIATAVVVIALVCIAAAPNDDTPNVVRAKEFQLIGKDGKAAGKLEVLGTGAYLRLNESDGRSSALITANNQRAGLYMENDDRINSASIEAYAGGGAVGLSRTTGNGKLSTEVVGGKDECLVKTKGKDGEEKVMP